LSYNAPNRTKFGGSPQQQEQVSKSSFFSSPKISLLILDELEELGFGKIGRNLRDLWARVMDTL
jgi:hypothetical protein